jgi:hypothetical protein
VKNWLWIAGLVLGVIVLASVIYYSMDDRQQATQSEYAPTPTNMLPNNPNHYTKESTPTPTETPTPTPATVKPEATTKEEFIIGERTSQAITYDGILEVDFQQREYTRLADYRVAEPAEEYGTWEAVYEIPTLCTAIRFRLFSTTLFEQLGKVKGDTAEYYSFFNSDALTRNGDNVVIPVSSERETDSLMIFLNPDEARIVQNGVILATCSMKDKRAQCKLSLESLDQPDYCRYVYISEDGRPESMYIEETDTKTACYDRLTRKLIWQLTRNIDGERMYLLEARDPRSTEDHDDMIVLYRGEPEIMPTEVYGVTNTSFSLWDRIEEAEADAEMPTREWEESVHTSILVSNSYGTLYMNTVYCGYLYADGDESETIRGTVIERILRWENPELHISLENVVSNPDCAIDSRIVLNDAENPRYLLRSYAVSDRKSRSRAETVDGALLWVEEAMLADGEPYRLERTYTDHVRVQYFSNKQLYAEEITDFAGKRNRITQFTYEDDRIQRSETRDSADNLIETCDYIYDAIGELVKSVKKTYDAEGNLSGSVTYDKDGKVITDSSPEK